MTKADIISEITEQTGLQKKEVAVVVESFMNTVKSSMLDKKENVYLRGFGSIVQQKQHVTSARKLLSLLRLTTFPALSLQKLSLTK